MMFCHAQDVPGIAARMATAGQVQSPRLHVDAMDGLCSSPAPRIPHHDHRYAKASSVSEADDDDEAQAAKPKAPKKVIKDQGFSVTCKKCKGSFRLQKGDGVTFCTKNDEL